LRLAKLIPSASSALEGELKRLGVDGWRDEIAGNLHGAGRRLMAAECMAFLEAHDTRLERWQPYWDWYRLVTVNDWVITFNYDLLVETLQANAANHGFDRFPLHLDDRTAQRGLDLHDARQRIHAGFLIERVPVGPIPDLRPEEARDAVQTADAVVRAVLMWLERNPT
jgi:hypothetical protein